MPSFSPLTQSPKYLKITSLINKIQEDQPPRDSQTHEIRAVELPRTSQTRNIRIPKLPRASQLRSSSSGLLRASKVFSWIGGNCVAGKSATVPRALAGVFDVFHNCFTSLCTSQVLIACEKRSRLTSELVNC